MRIAKKIIWFYLVPLNAFAQGATFMDSFLIAKTPTTYSSINSNLMVASCDDFQSRKICFYDLKSTLLLDVFAAYNLEDAYETKLQKATFMESEDYKIKLDDLKIMKQKYLYTCMYLDMTKNEGFSISDYNIDLGKFTINLGFETKDRINHFSSNYYELKSIPFKIVQSDNQGLGEILYDRIISLPKSKRDALSIENNRERLKCLVIFKPQTIKKEDHPLFPGYHNYEYYVTMDKVRLILIDPSNDEIYLDTNYYLPKAPAKK